MISKSISNLLLKLKSIFSKIDEAGKGAVVFINQEVQSFNLLNRLQKLKNKDIPAKKPASSMDDKDFGIGAQILHDLDIYNIKLISNSNTTKKRVGMTGYGLKITDRIPY